MQAICLALERLGGESPAFAELLRRSPAAAAQEACGLETGDPVHQVLIQQIVRWFEMSRNEC